jgi:uncharacterized protein YkwD
MVAVAGREVRSRRATWPVGALTILLGLGSPALARPGLVASINAVRAAGCEGRAGLATPLRPSRELGEAARRLAGGAALANALDAAGYHAVVAASLQVSGAADDAIVARSVAHRACDALLNASVTQVGIARAASEVWLVLAAPFPSAGLRDVGAVSHRLVELANAARSRPRRCGTTSFRAAPPLALSERLTRAARAHAADMAAHDVLRHEGSDGSEPADRVTRAGYRWRLVGENVASGIASPEEAVKRWLASPGHCANLMGPDFTETGVAYVVEPSSTGRIYWTQVFAAPAR